MLSKDIRRQPHDALLQAVRLTNDKTIFHDIVTKSQKVVLNFSISSMSARPFPNTKVVYTLILIPNRALVYLNEIIPSIGD